MYPHDDWFYDNVAKFLMALSQSFKSAKPHKRVGFSQVA
jgi:uncharacterized lipoprotein YddW (UPF0748 family)